MTARRVAVVRTGASKVSLVVATAPASAGLRSGQVGNGAADLARVASHLEQAAADLRKLATVLPAAPRVDGPSPPAPLLSVNALAARLGVRGRTIRRWRDAGKLPPAVAVGGILRWRPEIVDAWLQAREGAR